MGNISVTSGAANTQLLSGELKTRHGPSQVDELNVTVSDSTGQYTVSAEAQYLFEMQKYFHTLNAVEQDRAVEYFSQSTDPLHNKLADDLRTLQEFSRDLREGKIKIVHDEEALLKATNLLNKNWVTDEKTEIGVRPNGTDVFRLDGKQDYFPAQGYGSNPALFAQLNALEQASSGLLRNRDSANLFGSVSNALVYSENILLSADDVLHYNYAIEKARKTIEFVTAPEDLKNAVTHILERGIAWQAAKQNKAIADNYQLIGNSRVGHLAADAVRMGSAAQAFNQTLLSTLTSSNISLLNAGSIIKRLIVEQPDLIQFSSSKIDEALDYYSADYSLYEKALNRPSVLPTEKTNYTIFDNQTQIFEASQKYALKVIDEIQGYVSNQKT
jgi:hypothetical protein